jgi:hypothetical protein
MERVADLAGQRDAEVPAADARHEVEEIDADPLRRADEVAFVLAVLVVDENDHAAGAQLVEDFGNRGERHGRHHPSGNRRS